MVLQFEDVVDCLKKNQISILQAAAIPDDDGTRLTRITATLGYSRGHHGYIFSCSTIILQLRLVMLCGTVVGRMTVVRGKPWILELGCRRSTGSGHCSCRKWFVVHQTVRGGILGGLGHSDSRVEFGSCVFGHLERGMAKSGKRGHRTGWGHPNSHIRFVTVIWSAV
jgi:hypothetical protein